MGTFPLFEIVERDLLARFPAPDAAPASAAVYEEIFGLGVSDVAEAVAISVGVVDPADLDSFVALLATIITNAIKQAALDVGVLDQPWMPEAQRWAVKVFFVRLAEFRATMTDGGRA